MYTRRSRVFGALGQSASERPSVVVIQRALRTIAAENDNADYFPGPDDGRYGMNTHAAIIRVSRDFLEPAGLVSGTCRSTCNTLWTRARSACKDCLGQMLSAMNQQFGAVNLSASDIASIADAYGEWLDAYVARYGDGGQLDSAQIARREEVSLEEAERLAAERSGVPEGGDTVAIAPVEGEIEGPPVRQAKFPWLVVVLSVVAIGGSAAAYWYFSRKPEEEGLDFEPEQDFEPRQSWLR